MSAHPSKLLTWLERSLALVPLLLIIPVVVRSPLGQSLWLDETLTAWVTGEGMSEVMTRSVEYQGQSPLYFTLIFWLRSILGNAEWVLRLPSLLAALGSLYFVWCITQENISRWVAPLAVTVLLSLDCFQVAAFSARPYSLALMCSLLSFLAFRRWLESGRMWRGLVYILCSLLTIYLHYFFALMLLVHGVYLLQHGRGKVTKVNLISVYVLLVSLLGPAAIHISILLGRSEEIRFLTDPTVKTFLRDIFPINVVIAVVVGLNFAILFERRWCLGDPLSKIRYSTTFLVWYLLPPLVFFLQAYCCEGSWYLSRYFLWYAPALAIVVAAIVAALPSGKTATVAALGIFVMLFAREADRRWVPEPWREAAMAAREFTAEYKGPVLVYSGLAESDEASWAKDFMKGSYLNAPLEYYVVSRKPIALSSQPEGQHEKVAALFAVESDALFIAADKKRAGASVVTRWMEEFHSHGLESCEIELISGQQSSVRAFVLYRKMPEPQRPRLCERAR